MKSGVDIVVTDNSSQILFLLTFLIILFYACDSKKDEQILGKSDHQILIDSDSLGFIRDLIVSNNYLVLLDSKPLNDDKQLRIYDLRNSKFLYTLGREGAGPGEFRQGMSLNKIDDGKKGFSLMDLSSKKVLIYEYDNLGRLNYLESVQLKEGRPYMPLVVDDSTIYSLGLELFTGRIAKYDYSGNLLETLGDIPPGKENDTPVPVHLQACKGILRVTPNLNNFIISYQFADLIDIYNKNGVLLKRINDKIGRAPKYKTLIRSGYPTFFLDEEEAILGYLDIRVTDSLIIALFSGELVATAQYETNIIQVFNLEGKLLKTVTLDIKISQIEIDENNNRLIAVSYYPTPIVYAFNLEKILH
ncbi:MAG: BF3164 family lipoprotein [Ignavibacteriaceae bacterium]|jgi:hypothetical protein|nr:BF3164 family lipoprotein [Ignavibacteriaceae bacterium]